MEKIHGNMHVFVLSCKVLTYKHKNMHVSVKGLLHVHVRCCTYTPSTMRNVKIKLSGLSRSLRPRIVF